MTSNRSKETRELIKKAVADGWEYLGHTGAGSHVRLRWPKTGQTVTIPGTPSDVRSLSNSRAIIARIQRGTYPWGRRRKDADT